MTAHPSVPTTTDRFRKPRVAVVGSGISGLGAARLLARDAEVVVFEANSRPGGHSNTIDVPGEQGPIPVDTGFIVYNERNYPRLTALFAELGVETRASDMSFSNACAACGVELGSNNLRSLFAQPWSFLRPARYSLILGLLAFFKSARADLAAGYDFSGMTLRDYLRERRVSSEAVRHFVLPMGAAVWSAAPGDMLQFPAETFLRFFANHGMLGVRGAPQWRTVVGGSRRYVAKLVDQSGFALRLSQPAVRVRRDDAGVMLIFRHDAPLRFDAVLLAVHSDTALALLDDPTPDETRVLGAMGTTKNDAWLHTDDSFLPRAPAARASWNHRVFDCRGAAAQVEVTYWMNRLQSLPTRKPVLVTLNPARPIAGDAVSAHIQYEHPRFDLAALEAQSRVGTLQGRRHTWFAGAWQGYGFHEDGLRSGQEAARSMLAAFTSKAEARA